MMGAGAQAGASVAHVAPGRTPHAALACPWLWRGTPSHGCGGYTAGELHPALLSLLRVSLGTHRSISSRRTSRPGQLSAFIPRVAEGEYHSGEYWAQSHELCLPAAGHVNNAGKTKFRARRLGLCFSSGVNCIFLEHEQGRGANAGTAYIRVAPNPTPRAGVAFYTRWPHFSPATTMHHAPRLPDSR